MPVLLTLSVLGCGGAELPPPTQGGPLQGCQLEEEPGIRTWSCGELLAQELAAGTATDAETRQVLEDFAQGLASTNAARTDVPWARDAQRFPSVRMEGTGPSGQRFVAQMVVVTDPEGSRVVQCVSRNPVAPCEPILDHLVRR